MTVRFVAASFQPYLDTAFRVATSAGDVDLRLAEVTDVRRGRFDGFSLLFHGPGDQILPQGQYAFEHDVLGKFELFIVPVVGSDAERALYEAVFNVTPEAPPAR